MLERTLSLGFGVVTGALVAALGFAQLGIGFLTSRRRRGEPGLPAHEDPARVVKYTEIALERLRVIGDPQTDPLIDVIAATAPAAAQAGSPGANPQVGAGAPQSQQGGAPVDPQVAVVEQFFRDLIHDRYFDIASHRGRAYEPQLKQWAARITLPPDADLVRLERAGRFFERNLSAIILIQGTSSLLEAYACRKGVQVLASTALLSNKTNQRLKETLQFVLYVNEPFGFKAGTGHGLDAIRKVRLMHAAIRWLIPRKRQWSVDFGTPVNGEDLLGMLMGFSGVVLRDLPEFGITLKSEEAEDHIYLWNLVGRLLGVDIGLLPANLSESLALIRAIKRRNQEPSDEGTKMAKALVDFHEWFLGRDLLPIGIAAMRRLAGRKICNMLGVPYTELADREGPMNFLLRVWTFWGRYLVGFYETVQVNGEPYEPYDVPKELQSAVFA